jgi:hypothetical protein
MANNEEHDYWKVSHPPLIDELNSKCSCGHHGIYIERGFLDKYNGVVACNSCGNIKPRWTWIIEYSN